MKGWAKPIISVSFVMYGDTMVIIEQSGRE